MNKKTIMAAVAFAICGSAAASDECDWSRPGERPFVGNKAAAVRAYKDIPEDARERLAIRVEAAFSRGGAKTFDDMVEISAGGMVGQAGHYANLRQMYFGAGRKCDKVSMREWPFDLTVRAMVFRDGQHAIAVPLVCGNVSQISLVQKAVAPASPQAVAAVAPAAVVAAAPGFTVNAPPGWLLSNPPAGVPMLPQAAARPAQAVGAPMPYMAARSVDEPDTLWIVLLSLVGIGLLANHHRKDLK